MRERSLAASEWFIYTVPFVLPYISNSHAINGLSFSHDGEYLAISNTSTYIDIVSLHQDNASSLSLTPLSKCAVETGVPIYRVPTAGPVSTVTWHPSKHLIAFCGQTKVREGTQTPTALVSLFGAN